MPPIPQLLVFMGLVLSLALYGLTLSGHFPAEHRSASLASPLGQLILWGTIFLATGLLIAAIVLAWRRLPLAAAIISGGAMVLIAPLALQRCPDRFLNERGGLLAFAALGLVFALLGQSLPP